MVDKKIKPNPELKNVLLGGGFISKELVEQATDLGWKITKVYGSTETASFVTALSPKDFELKPASAGKPIAPNKIIIIDENNNALAKNISGEVLISSPSLMQGYLIEHDKDESKEKYFHSNDIGFIDDDGYLFLESRKSDLIISGGENISPFEIEKEILQHFAIKETAVFPLKFNVKDLNAYLKNKLAGFKIPKNVFIEKELPKTELGKVEKKKIIEKYSKTNH